MVNHSEPSAKTLIINSGIKSYRAASSAAGSFPRSRRAACDSGKKTRIFDAFQRG